MTVIKKLLKYKTSIILYEITTDTSTVYLSIIDNETKDTNRKHIKYNKGLVGQRTNQSYSYVRYTKEPMLHDKTRRYKWYRVQYSASRTKNGIT